MITVIMTTLDVCHIHDTLRGFSLLNVAFLTMEIFSQSLWVARTTLIGIGIHSCLQGTCYKVHRSSLLFLGGGGWWITAANSTSVVLNFMNTGLVRVYNIERTLAYKIMQTK